MASTTSAEAATEEPSAVEQAPSKLVDFASPVACPEEAFEAFPVASSAIPAEELVVAFAFALVEQLTSSSTAMAAAVDCSRGHSCTGISN